MSQKELSDFFVQDVVPGGNDLTKDYVVTFQDGKWSCSGEHCKLMQDRRPCRHVLMEQVKLLRERCDYYKDREKFESQATFGSLEQVLMALELHDSFETNYIQSLILAFAYANKEVRSDDIYIIMDGSFNNKNYRKLPACFGALVCKGMIISIGTYHSKRPRNNSRKSGIYVLTEAGKRIMDEFKVGT